MGKKAKKALFSSAAVVLSMLLLEISCYFILRLPALENKNARNWRRNYKDSGLYEGVDLDAFYDEGKATNETMAFDFYRYYRPTLEFTGKYISTDSQGFRNTVQYSKSRNSKGKVIVFLGASTMWGAGAAGDYATIPSQFSKYLSELAPQINYEVKNYGVGGYQNMQQMILLMEKLGEEQIDFVIFYDWTSEAIMGYRELRDGKNSSGFLQPSVSVGYQPMIRFLIDRGMYDQSIKLAVGTRDFIGKSNIVKVLLKLRDSLGARKRLEDKGQSEGLNEKELKQAERIVRLYRKNKKIIEALAKTFDFRPYFIMHPNLFTKKQLSDYEAGSPFWNEVKSVEFQRKVYELAKEEFGGDSNFYDISDCMNTEETVYIDDHHTTLRGNSLTAQALVSRIGSEIVRLSRE